VAGSPQQANCRRFDQQRGAVQRVQLVGVQASARRFPPLTALSKMARSNTNVSRIASAVIDVDESSHWLSDAIVAPLNAAAA
jgi:hypothetical protein